MADIPLFRENMPYGLGLEVSETGYSVFLKGLLMILVESSNCYSKKFSIGIFSLCERELTGVITELCLFNAIFSFVVTFCGIEFIFKGADFRPAKTSYSYFF